MKKLPAFLLTFLLLVCLIPTQCFAAVQKENVVYHADGSYTVTRIEQMPTARAAGSVTGSKVTDHYSGDNVLVWKATLQATFTYDGSSARCTAVDNLSVRIFESGWSMASKSSSKSGNTATGNITMRYSGLTGAGNFPITLTLSCDKNGNLS